MFAYFKNQYDNHLRTVLTSCQLSHNSPYSKELWPLSRCRRFWFTGQAADVVDGQHCGCHEPWRAQHRTYPYL